MNIDSYGLVIVGVISLNWIINETSWTNVRPCKEFWVILELLLGILWHTFNVHHYLTLPHKVHREKMLYFGFKLIEFKSKPSFYIILAWINTISILSVTGYVSYSMSGFMMADVETINCHLSRGGGHNVRGDNSLVIILEWSPLEDQIIVHTRHCHF